MATIVKSLNDGLSETVASGDTLVLVPRVRRKESDPYPTVAMAVFPAAGSVTVESTLSPSGKISANADDPTINWFSWPLGVITPASPTKDGLVSAHVGAIRIKPSGGNCVVEARI